MASGDHSSSRCAGLSPSRPLLLRSTGSRCAGSVVVAHGPSCSAACGIFPDQGLNPYPLHWQADSQPLHHQGSPRNWFIAPGWGTLSSVVPRSLVNRPGAQGGIMLTLPFSTPSLTQLRVPGPSYQAFVAITLNFLASLPLC